MDEHCPRHIDVETPALDHLCDVCGRHWFVSLDQAEGIFVVPWMAGGGGGCQRQIKDNCGCINCFPYGPICRIVYVILCLHSELTLPGMHSTKVRGVTWVNVDLGVLAFAQLAA
jgi:hypothetical protein